MRNAGVRFPWAAASSRPLAHFLFCERLTKGTKYQLKGWQMLKEENAELIIDGKRVENDYTFVADDKEMKVEISYTFNASALGG